MKDWFGEFMAILVLTLFAAVSLRLVFHAPIWAAWGLGATYGMAGGRRFPK